MGREGDWRRDWVDRSMCVRVCSSKIIVCLYILYCRSAEGWGGISSAGCMEVLEEIKSAWRRTLFVFKCVYVYLVLIDTCRTACQIETLKL